ncbi:hypothetical protein IWQ60_011486, partial [Tieghemiomyces parasiticus]
SSLATATSIYHGHADRPSCHSATATAAETDPEDRVFDAAEWSPEYFAAMWRLWGQSLPWVERWLLRHVASQRTHRPSLDQPGCQVIFVYIARHLISLPLAPIPLPTRADLATLHRILYVLSLIAWTGPGQGRLVETAARHCLRQLLPHYAGPDYLRLPALNQRVWHPVIYGWLFEEARGLDFPWPKFCAIYDYVLTRLTPGSADGLRQALPAAWDRLDSVFLDRVLADLTHLQVALPNYYLYNTLRSYVTLEDLPRAERLFNDAPNRQAGYTVAMYTEMIRLYGRRSHWLPLCLDTFSKLLDRGLTPSPTTLIVLADAFATHGEVGHVKRIVRHLALLHDEQHPNQPGPTLTSSTGVTADFYGIRSNPHLASILLKGLFAQGRVHMIIPTFHRLQREGYTISHATYHTVLRAYAWMNRMDLFGSTLRDMTTRHGLAPNARTYCIVLRCHVETGQWDVCQRVVDHMLASGIRPTIDTLTVLLPAILNGQCVIEVPPLRLPGAEGLSDEAPDSDAVVRVTPTALSTYTGVCTILAQLDLRPTAPFYRGILEWFWTGGKDGGGGGLHEMIQLWRGLDHHDVALTSRWAELTGVIIRILLRHQLFTQAERFLAHAETVHPDRCHTSELYRIRITFYATRDRYDEVVELIRAMSEHGVPIRLRFVARAIAYARRAGRFDVVDEIVRFVEEKGIGGMPRQEFLDQADEDLRRAPW